jgi:hypothetical protein
MRLMTRVLCVLTCAVALGSTATAGAQEPLRLTLPAVFDDIPADTADAGAASQAPTARPVAIEYSDAYYTRAKIHKYASVATLPLFATEVYLGQALYDGNGDDTKKGAHAAVGAGIGGLFALNTVTGVWNMWEARKDPAHRKLRVVHGILMLAADGGFAMTAAMTPNTRRIGPIVLSNDASTHRALALTSIGIATGSYLLMLFGNK